MLTPTVETWLANARTPADRAREVRAAFARDEAEDLSELRPFRREGALMFTQRTAALIDRKPSRTILS